MNIIRFVLVSMAIVLFSGNLAIAKISVSDKALSQAMEYVTSSDSIMTISKYLAKKVKRGDVTFDTMQVPNVVFISQQELNKRFLEDELDATMRKIAKNLRAAYDDITNTIYLLDTWDETNVFDMETLVHEMVHHAQYHGGVNNMKMCSAALEGAAYKIGLRYLIDNNAADDNIIQEHKWQSFAFGKCKRNR